MEPTGVIYLRDNAWYVTENVIKMGIASFAKDRASVYTTGEILRGSYALVIEIPLKHLRIVDNLLKCKFAQYRIYRGGGTEFYDRNIHSLIQPFLETIDIAHKILSETEINGMERCHRLHEITHINRIKTRINAINMGEFVQKLAYTKMVVSDRRLLAPLNPPLTNSKPALYVPRADQAAIIDKACEYYQSHDKGMLILTCGVGKTLISLWITQRLALSAVLIGVPNILLLRQWQHAISQIMPDTPILLVAGNISVEAIVQFIAQHVHKCAVITTYASSHKVFSATSGGYVFDMKINDEAHHLTTTNMQLSQAAKTYVQMLHIQSNTQLSLTATLKQIDPATTLANDDQIVSNDNIVHFGEIIDSKCLLWAINQGIICDYVIQTIVTDEEQIEHHFVNFQVTDETDKRLFLTAYASLKSINDGHSHHLLVYSNSKKNALKIAQYVKLLLDHRYFDIPGMYCSVYHSEISPIARKQILSKFETAKCGMLTNVYCLGEGFDNCVIDGVVFAENMASNIRIVQSALRASRKNTREPAKKAKIILPILNRDDWFEDTGNPDLKKVKEIIYQMGLEDTTIAQKLMVFKIRVEPQPAFSHVLKDTSDCTVGEYDDKLTQQLKLKTTKRTALATTYAKAVAILAKYCIQSKAEYYKLCAKNNRLPEDPEVTFKGQFINWIEYLSIERVYYNIYACKTMIATYLREYPLISQHYLDLARICVELCKIDARFPPNELWTEYYGVAALSDVIMVGTTTRKKKAGILA